MKKCFPQEIIKLSVENHFSKFNNKSYTIYITILLFLMAIARALYHDPKILIMDEATSSLDSEAEYHVQQTINQLKSEGKTILIIAHRLSTVLLADNIVVLENGKLIEQGNHQELYNNKGKYYGLWQKQMPGYKQTSNKNYKT